MDDRIYKVCGTGVEDEEHFLTTCSAYNDIRSECLQSIGLNSDSPRLCNIMVGKGDNKEIGAAVRYIKRAMTRRERILEYTG